MSAIQCKEIVQSFFERFSATDVEGALSLLNDAVVWRAMGREGDLPVSGEMDKDGIAQLITSVREMMPKGLSLTPTGWTVEGNRVAVEIESYGEKTNGVIYNNFYHFLVETKEGGISTIREYLDTIHVRQVFVDDVN